jgi:prepilin-type N-terminal cleavage/methylation domain-containing protein
MLKQSGVRKVPAVCRTDMKRSLGRYARWESFAARPRVRAPAAFSLLELLVVVGVIGILLSLLLPALLRAHSRARQAQCVHNAHQLGLGLSQFVADYHVYPLAINSAFRKGGYPEHHADWTAALEAEGLSASKNNRFYEVGVWRCPAASRPWGFPADSQYGSYAYNAFGLKLPQKGEPLGLGGHREQRGGGLAPPPVSESEVLQPSGMMAIGESFSGGIDFMRWSQQALSRWNAASRHHGKASVLCCDGHVDSASLNSLFADTNSIALSRWNRDNQPHRECLALE